MSDALLGRRRLVVLASGGGSNLQAVLDACADGRLNATVVAVLSDRGQAFALERADAAGVPAVWMDPKRADDRRAYDIGLAEAVAAYKPDWIVLAGWMRILSAGFLDRFPGRVLNLHPARPGELAGLHAISRAFDEGLAGLRTSTGVMVHLVPDEAVDAGPVLGTVDVAIRSTDYLVDLERRVHDAEHRLLVDVLAALCRGRTAESLTRAVLSKSLQPESLLSLEAQP